MRAREKSEIVNHERRQLLTTATMGLVAAGAASLLATYRAQAATGEAREAVRPFYIHFPEKDLVDLRHRLAATRWPEKETVDDDTQGVPHGDHARARAPLADRLRLAKDRSAP